jgi:hypothetical protein
MKFSTAFTALVVIVPLFAGQALAAAAQANNAKGQGGNNNNGGKNNNNNGAQNNNTAAAANNNTAAAASNSTANNNGGGGNAQTSLTLDPKVLATGFESNGQQTPTAGQVASLTSSNNFINFCLTVNKPITNGQQIKTGSCNPAPMGVIAATTNMPSSKFQSPVNGQDLTPNTSFNINMAVNNLQTGNFVNAETNYYSAPQQVNAQGNIIGHTHYTVQAIPSFTSTTPLDPNTFAFFKGVNSPAVNGVVTEPVTGGLPAGFYRACSINTDANHAPCLVAVAQHGSLDDCVYFSVGQGNGANALNGNGAAANNGAKGAANNGTNVAPPPANNGTSVAPPPASNGAKGAANNGTTAAPPPAKGAPPPAKAAPPPAKGAPAPAKAAPPPAKAAPPPVIGAKGSAPNNQQQLGNKKSGRRTVARLARDH